jgi:predicted enzyme related to lactoylglutathione lyase
MERRHDMVRGISLREGTLPIAPQHLPTSNVFFHCDDLARTEEELWARGVEFWQPPVRQPLGWGSTFQDSEGNRFALAPREGETQ